MDAIDGDPQLASEVLGIMGRELKAAKARVKELELAEKSMQDRLRSLEARAEAAERRATQLTKERDEGAVRLSAAVVDAHRREIKQEMKTEVEGPDALGSSAQHVKDLEQQLEKYYAKYKAEKSKNKEMAESYAALQEQIELLEATLQDAQKKLVEPKIPQVLLKSGAQCIRDIITYMSSLPKTNTRPRNRDLEPICSRNVDIRTLLQLANVDTQVLDNFLYLPDRIHWCTGAGSHALGFSPMQAVDVTGVWVKKPPQFRDLYGRQFHLFFSTNDDVRYCGIYRALDLRHMGSEGHANLPTQIVGEGDAIIEASITPSKHVDGREKKNKKNLVKLYQAHILKVELLGLQCVGFDATLYDALRAKFVKTVGRNDVYYPASAKEVAQESKKRKREE